MFVVEIPLSFVFGEVEEFVAQLGGKDEIEIGCGLLHFFL